jgi:pyrroloquinoline quinone biosynthesis protein D
MQTNLDNLTFTLNKKFRFQWEEAQHCHVLLFPEGMIKLSDTAGIILQYCTTQTTHTYIVSELTKKFPDAETLNTDVLEFLQEAFQQGWLTAL